MKYRPLKSKMAIPNFLYVRGFSVPNPDCWHRVTCKIYGLYIYLCHLDVSLNGVTPKSSILIGFSIINHPFWGTTILGNPHLRGPSKCCKWTLATISGPLASTPWLLDVWMSVCGETQRFAKLVGPPNLVTGAFRIAWRIHQKYQQ